MKNQPEEALVKLSRLKRAGALIVAILVMLGAAGCAANKLSRIGEREEASGNYDRAVLVYAKLAAAQPTNHRWQISLSRAKQRASQVHFEKAKDYQAAGHLELAIGELQQASILDPANKYALTELENAMRLFQAKRASVKITEMERMKAAARSSRGVPLLNPKSNIPMVFGFRDYEIGKIYEAISKTTGINFLYDPKLDGKKKVTIELNNVPFEKAMDTLMLTNKHFFKVMDENTILIADDNQQKRKEYEDEVIKTFFLSNADVKDVQSLLRTLLDARKTTQNTQLNAITIRDTPNKVAIAQRIIESNDKAKAELIVDVELLEISRTVSKTLGINLTSAAGDTAQIGVAWDGPGSLPLNNLGLLNQLGLYSLGPIPRVTIDFLKSDGGTRTIAKPQLRVTEGEKANLHIGDSVPIPTTTFNTAINSPTSGGGFGSQPITSYTYQEVGIVIEIEPRVHHNKEVTMKLNVEVSQLGELNRSGQPSINTRQINTVIRLSDGESNLLAGLIRDDGASGRSGYPGLMDVPGLGKIFSSSRDTRRETDLILTLTPHIIRMPDIRQEDFEAFWIGNEGNLRLRGDAGSVFSTPFTTDEEATEEDPEADDAAGAEGEGEAGAPTDPSSVAPKPEQVQGSAGTNPVTPAASAAPTPAGTPPPQQPPSPAVLPGDDPTGAGETPTDEPKVAASGPANPIPSQAVNPPGTMNMTIAPARLTVASGGTFSVNVLINNVANLQKMSFTLSYDPATVEFDSGLEGIIMKQDGTQTMFSASKVAEGQVTVEVSRLGGTQGISRGGALAALRFRAVAAGRAKIGVATVGAESFEGASIAVAPGESEITVSN